MRQRYWLWASIPIFSVIFWLFISEREVDLPDSYVGKDVAVILAAIPKRDRERLEYFFLESIRRDCFGYVLLGKKPMAWGGLTTAINPFACFWEKDAGTIVTVDGYEPHLHEKFLWHLQQALSSQRMRSNRAYQTWRRYEKFFPMSRFSIIYENNYHDGCDELSIVLINRKAFIQTVRENIQDFTKILGRDVDPEKLLQEAEHKPLFSDILMNHDGLIGTLLGYGRENAFWFHQKYRMHLEEERNVFRQVFQLQFALTDEFSGPWTDREDANCCSLSDDPSGLDDVLLPGFRANFSSDETQSLRTQYLETRQTILNYYQGKDFLETTLDLLRN